MRNCTVTAKALAAAIIIAIKLLDSGAIAHRKVGKHRRIRMEDVMEYKNQIDQQREEVLDQLAAEAQAHDIGYPRR